MKYAWVGCDPGFKVVDSYIEPRHLNPTIRDFRSIPFVLGGMFCDKRSFVNLPDFQTYDIISVAFTTQNGLYEAIDLINNIKHLDQKVMLPLFSENGNGFVTSLIADDQPKFEDLFIDILESCGIYVSYTHYVSDWIYAHGYSADIYNMYYPIFPEFISRFCGEYRNRRDIFVTYCDDGLTHPLLDGRANGDFADYVANKYKLTCTIHAAGPLNRSSRRENERTAVVNGFKDRFDFLRMLGNHKVLLHRSFHHNAPGQVIGECTSLGVVPVGGNSDFYKLLYPDLPTGMEADVLEECVYKVLTDDEYRNFLLAKAKSTMSFICSREYTINAYNTIYNKYRRAVI